MPRPSGWRRMLTLFTPASFIGVVPSREHPPILASAFEGLRLIWSSPRLRALFPALLVVFSGWMLTFIYLPIVVQRIHGDDGLGTAVGIALGASGLVTLIASPAIGAIADRLGHWRVVAGSFPVSRSVSRQRRSDVRLQRALVFP